MLAIVAAVIAFLFIKDKKTSRFEKAVRAYYENKRREFPWLDNWINEWSKLNGDMIAARVKDVKGDNAFMTYYLFALPILVILIFPKWIPIHVILIAGSIFFSEFMSREKAKEPGEQERLGERGLTLECPSCHCPHAWVMTRKEVVIDGSDTSRSTTTTTTTTRVDSFESFSHGVMNDSSKTKVRETTTYYGRDFRDFKCLNCGHTTVGENSWDGYSNPDSGVFNYDPPMPAWEKGSEIEKKVAEKQRNNK